MLLPAEPSLQPLEHFPDVTLVFPSSKVIRDVIKVHMEELSSHWQEEQGRAGDAAVRFYKRDRYSESEGDGAQHLGKGA